jgi:hypothetical protein
MLNDTHIDSYGNYNVIENKTISKVFAKGYEDGAVRDAAMLFTDGTEIQIGATSEGLLSFVCRTSKMSQTDDWHTKRLSRDCDKHTAWLHRLVRPLFISDYRFEVYHQGKQILEIGRDESRLLSDYSSFPDLVQALRNIADELDKITQKKCIPSTESVTNGDSPEIEQYHRDLGIQSAPLNLEKLGLTAYPESNEETLPESYSPRESSASQTSSR